jgi:hypothetical protein
MVERSELDPLLPTRKATANIPNRPKSQIARASLPDIDPPLGSLTPAMRPECCILIRLLVGSLQVQQLFGNFVTSVTESNVTLSSAPLLSAVFS